MISNTPPKNSPILNNNTAKSTPSSPLNQTGLVAKLSSEISQISRLNTTTLHHSEPLQFQGKPAQLLHASNAQGAFSLLNTGKPVDIHNAKPSQLSPLPLASRVVSLTVTSTAPPSAQGTQTVTVTDGQTSFPIISQTLLKKGDSIRVFVDSDHKMQVLPSALEGKPSSISLDALKQSLPRQLSFTDMSQLVKQLQTLSGSMSSLSPQAQTALKQLVQYLPNIANLTQSPEAMKSAIQSSGLFSESILANDNKTQLPADLKLNLTRLKDTFESNVAAQTNKIATEQIASAVERITTNQLRHFSDVNGTQSPTYPLHIELPITEEQNVYFIQMEIDQDASTEEQDKHDRRWLVKLKFDFEETGRFDARTSIQNNQVGALFAAENSDTVQRLQQQLPTLKKQLEEQDIEVNRLDAFQAKITEEAKKAPSLSSLIDVRT
ncbi:flagellar hook-length control protein FliK [Marinomonas algarum]|uniref:Flagellar hook-length control protein FliK n=1 Tax=Marinomonas algarum TaxID=2883105 RepID=A0A9X1IMG7_9GAMM|nr:flagellar hook-length control protein FliK [Marinomonas algarum]MCB5161992.1 flagellar hook-length control protein FliK [Marinomonas algarum]